MRKSPGFAATAVATMALGMGASTAIFSVCDALLWKPMPLPRIDSLITVSQQIPGYPNAWDTVSAADVEDIRRENTAIESLTTCAEGLANIAGGGGEPERVDQALVSLDFFEVLGVMPARGRIFEPGSDQPGRDRQVILSDGLWRRRFNADPAAIGRTMRLDDAEYVIAGVMPPSFQFPVATQVWTPLAPRPADRTSRLIRGRIAFGRLKPGHTMDEAAAQLSATATRLEKTYPESNSGRRFMLKPIHEFLIGDYTNKYMKMMLVAVLFVLLIACVNVANLQFARATGRSREIALRASLGAGRWRLLTQMVTESILLGLGGATLGLLLAGWSLDLIKAGMPVEIEKYVLGWHQIRLDSRALVFTLAAAVASGILSGIAPAWQRARPNLAEALKEGSRGSSVGKGRHRLRGILVAAEVGLAVVLLIGASLMVRGFQSQVASSASLEPGSMLCLRMAITEEKYREPHQVAAFYREVLRKVAAVPGVRAAVAASALPYSNHSSSRRFTIEGKTVEPGRQPEGMYQSISPNYLDTMHVPLLAGRRLDGRDGAEAPPVVVISERLARRWWPGEALPLGRHIRIETVQGSGPWLTIVGVVGDLMHDTYDRAPRAALYVPFEQSPVRFMDIALRTAGDPLSAAPEVRRAIYSVDPAQPISHLRTMQKQILHNATGLTYVVVMMGFYGMLALVLSVLGVYSVMAYLVSEQTHDIGIRLALGAPRERVLGMILRRGMLTTFAGLAFGLPVAWVLARLLASLIFGVATGDPLTFVGIPLVLALAAALAILIPARRAMAVDPVTALRGE